MPTATVHSDGADGSVKTITLKATGATTGHISIAGSDGSAENFDLYDVAADPAALEMTCQASVFLANPHIAISVRSAAGKPVADITITHVIFGGGTTKYPLRAGEDAVIQTFLRRANFPPLRGSVRDAVDA